MAKKNVSCLFIPPEILYTKAVVETSTQCKMTPAAASSVLKSIIMESTYIGEEPSKKSELGIKIFSSLCKHLLIVANEKGMHKKLSTSGSRTKTNLLLYIGNHR